MGSRAFLLPQQSFLLLITVSDSFMPLLCSSSGELCIPSHISLLHVEQEVTGDDTVALDSVLECDTKRNALLNEEKDIGAKLNAG